MVKTRSIFGSGAIIAQSRCHMNFNHVNRWHRLGSCCLRVGRFFVCANARAGDRADSRTVSRRAWHYLQRPGTRDIEVCPENSSWGIWVPAAAGICVIALYQVLQPYHTKALGVLWQYAIGPMGRLFRERPGGGTAAPQGETARCL